MEEVKGILKSVTFWGIALSVVGKIAYIKGYDIGNTDGLAEALASFAGDGIALYGRIRANKRISM